MDRKLNTILALLFIVTLFSGVSAQTEDFEFLRTLEVGDQFIYTDQDTGQNVAITIYEIDEVPLQGLQLSQSQSTVINKANANTTSLLGIFPVEHSLQFPDELGLDLEWFGDHLDLNYTYTDYGTIFVEGYETRSIVADVGTSHLNLINATQTTEYETPITSFDDFPQDNRLIYNVSFHTEDFVGEGDYEVDFEFIAEFNTSFTVSDNWNWLEYAGLEKNVTETHVFDKGSVYLYAEHLGGVLKNSTSFNATKGFVNYVTNNALGIAVSIEFEASNGFNVERTESMLSLSQLGGAPKIMKLTSSSVEVTEYTIINNWNGWSLLLIIIDQVWHFIIDQVWHFIWIPAINGGNSTNVGPDQGQGGVGDGYLYTECSSPGANTDTWEMTFDTILDASAEQWQFNFYTCQRGPAIGNNQSLCHVQINENGGGWVTVATFGGAGQDTTDGTAWVSRSVDLSEGGTNVDSNTQVRIQIESEAASTFHADYGIDTVEIVGAPTTVYEIDGVTKDAAGDALGSVAVHLFKDNGDNTVTWKGYKLSNATTGVFTFSGGADGISDNDPNYFLVAYLDTTEDLMDVSQRDITPLETFGTPVELFLRSEASKDTTPAAEDPYLRSQADKLATQVSTSTTLSRVVQVSAKTSTTISRSVQLSARTSTTISRSVQLDVRTSTTISRMVLWSAKTSVPISRSVVVLAQISTPIRRTTQLMTRASTALRRTTSVKVLTSTTVERVVQVSGRQSVPISRTVEVLSRTSTTISRSIIVVVKTSTTLRRDVVIIGKTSVPISRTVQLENRTSTTLRRAVQLENRTSVPISRTVERFDKTSTSIRRTVSGGDNESRTISRTVQAFGRISRPISRTVERFDKTSTTISREVVFFGKTSTSLERTTEIFVRTSATVWREVETLDTIARTSTALERTVQVFARTSTTVRRTIQVENRTSTTISRTVQFENRDSTILERTVQVFAQTSTTVSRTVQYTNRSSTTLRRSVQFQARTSIPISRTVERFDRASSTISRDVSGGDNESRTISRIVQAVVRTSVPIRRIVQLTQRTSTTISRVAQIVSRTSRTLSRANLQISVRTSTTIRRTVQVSQRSSTSIRRTVQHTNSTSTTLSRTVQLTNKVSTSISRTNLQISVRTSVPVRRTVQVGTEVSTTISRTVQYLTKVSTTISRTVQYFGKASTSLRLVKEIFVKTSTTIKRRVFIPIQITGRTSTSLARTSLQESARLTSTIRREVERLVIGDVKLGEVRFEPEVRFEARFIDQVFFEARFSDHHIFGEVRKD